MEKMERVPAPRRADDEELTLQLTAPFALQLQEIFGSVGYNIDSAWLLEEDLAIFVDFGVAQLIHATWRRGFLQQPGADYSIYRREVETAAANSLEDGKGLPLEMLKKGLQLSLDLQFALQLEEIFGFAGCHHEKDSDLVISVNIELAKKLHTALGQNFMHNVEKEGFFNLFREPNEDAACNLRREVVQDEDEFEVEDCMEGDGAAEILKNACVCGNDDERRFWKIKGSPPSEDELFGVCCKRKSCQKEYLIERFCQEEIERGTPQILWRGKRLWMKAQLQPEYPDGCKEPLGREPVEEVSCLQKGDHITWKRKYGYWHHGVVTCVMKDVDKFDIMHWSNIGNSLRVKIRQETKTKTDLEGAYRVNYINIYRGAGDFWNRRLAVARAYSRRHKRDVRGSIVNVMAAFGEFNTDYVIFRANCEHFATYCVIGTAICYQSLMTMLLGAWKGKAKQDDSKVVAINDGIRKLTTASCVVLMRGIGLVQSLWEKRNFLKKGNTDEEATREDISNQINVFSGKGGLETFKKAASCFGSELQETLKSCAAVLSQIV